jgi:hypothetical protein
MTLKWHGDEILEKVVEASWDGLRRAAKYYHERLRDTLSVPNTGEKVKRSRGGRRGSYTVYPHPAPKGSPPRLRTGALKQNVKIEFDRPNLTARIGVRKNAEYGVFLELRGWPWLFSTLEKNWAQISELAKSGKVTP